LLAIQSINNCNPAILNILIQMKNNGKADTSIKFTDTALTHISKHTDLNQPEQVKQFIANKTVTNGTKRDYCIAYNRYCEHYQIQWQQPKYKVKAKHRRIPTTKKIDMLIARASKKLSLKLRLSKETGLRPIELCTLKVKDIDTDQRTIYPTTAKNGSARTLKISSNLNTALQDHINANKLNPNDELFTGTAGNYAHSYVRMRNNLANKINDQTLKSIRLYDFRHYFATMLYAKTRDILYVKQQMGHKNVETTLIYTQLLNIHDQEWTCKTATNVKEAKDLTENGFEYTVTTPDGYMLFRKRK
jgi:integrase